jgi:hypothetical protein
MDAVDPAGLPELPELLVIISRQIGALYESYALSALGLTLCLIYKPTNSIVCSYSITHDLDLLQIMSDVLTHDKILKETP